MIHLTDEMQDLIDNALENGTPCVLATASPDGSPNVGYRGGMMVFDRGSLAYWDRAQGSSMEYVDANPKGMVMFRDPGRRVAWTFRCAATVHRTGPVRDAVMARVVKSEIDRDPEGKGVAVVLQVTQALTLGGEVLQER